MKKIICAALCSVLALGLCAACDPGVDGPGGNGGSKGSISVHFMVGGFGTDVNTKLSADYKALTGVTVNFKPSYTQGEIQQLVNSQQEQYDIVMPLLNMYYAQDTKKLECLDDVYDAIPAGEEVAIKDKMNQDLCNYLLADDGHRYQMVANDSVSAICYNADTLDAAFGEGQWSLPLTTNELLKMSDDLVANGYYAFSTSTAINYYWDYLGTVWWAQYEGLESFDNFYQGKYWDGADWQYGAKINDAKGREISLNTLSQIMNTSKGRMHALASNMDFKNAQRAFLGKGYVNDKKKVGFMVNGDWLENEMASTLISSPQRIGMMRAPVVSELATKLTSVKTDERLAEIVKAVDANKTYAETATGNLSDLTEGDFEHVRQARLMVYTATPNYPIGIPANRPAAKKQLAKDFLVYLYSDRAQSIIAQCLQGLAYPSGYDVLSDKSVTVSDFVRSRYEAFGNDKINIFPRNSSPLVYLGGLGDTPGAGTGIDNALCTGKTATSLLASSKTVLEHNWENISKYIKTTEE
ncbi:MAG: hypothetical protein K2H43_01700 [Clostridia bacterium]|nr:hypothetical protein [Clostridia bacterium]